MPSADQEHRSETSFLPFNNLEVLRPKTGKHGTFETRVIEVAGRVTHGLFFRGADGDGEHLVVIKHNGHACDRLATRMIEAWNGGDTAEAVEQFKYILRTGGMGIRLKLIEALAEDGWTVMRSAEWSVTD